MKQILDLSSLQSASDQLKVALEFSESDLAKSNSSIFEQFRNSVVQCYEYTYELCVKTLRRHLELTVDTPDLVDDWDFKDLIREAAIRGLIEKPDEWFLFRKYRNISSHAYDKSKAEEVYRNARDLLSASRALLRKIEKRMT